MLTAIKAKEINVISFNATVFLFKINALVKKI